LPVEINNTLKTLFPIRIPLSFLIIPALPGNKITLTTHPAYTYS
jgi:hypothetical protein